MDIIMTCDVGTTALKCTAFAADGRKLSDVRIEYGTEYPRPGWAQQSADMFADAALRGLRELAGGLDVRDVRVIGLSGQMNALIPVAAGPVYNPTLLTDRIAWSLSETGGLEADAPY